MCHWQNGRQDSCGLWSNVSQGLLHLTSITYPGCQRKSHSPSEGRIISIRGPEGLVQINPGKNTGE